MRRQAEEEEHLRLKVEEEARIAEDLRLKAESKEQAHVKVEEETRLAEELRLKAEAGGLCGAGVER